MLVRQTRGSKGVTKTVQKPKHKDDQVDFHSLSVIPVKPILYLQGFSRPQRALLLEA